MRKLIIILALFWVFLPGADACVGKILKVGSVESSEGKLFAEMLSILISERTGTTVNIKFFKIPNDIYDALKVRDVDILVENTARAAQMLNKQADGNPDKTYELVKKTYEKEKGLIWLKPCGFLSITGGTNKTYIAPVVRVEVFSEFPALPRVINKLEGVINDEIHARLLKSVESGEKPRKVARDFLRSKKLI